MGKVIKLMSEDDEFERLVKRIESEVGREMQLRHQEWLIR